MKTDNAITEISEKILSQIQADDQFWKGDRGRMYAIAFDLDTSVLQESYKNPSYANAYNDIKLKLAEFGFARQQGSVYFGNKDVNAVTCFLAVTALTKTFPWFAVSVRDIQMLRIEENSDLLPVINQALKP